MKHSLVISAAIVALCGVAAGSAAAVASQAPKSSTLVIRHRAADDHAPAGLGFGLDAVDLERPLAR